MENRLKELRLQNRKTQRDLAKYLNVSEQAIAYYEQGKRNPKLETWQKLADYFNVSVPYLQGEFSYDDLTPEGKKLEDRLSRTINDAINDELKYSELSSEENKRAIKLALQDALAYYA